MVPMGHNRIPWVTMGLPWGHHWVPMDSIGGYGSPWDPIGFPVGIQWGPCGSGVWGLSFPGSLLQPEMPVIPPPSSPTLPRLSLPHLSPRPSLAASPNGSPPTPRPLSDDTFGTIWDRIVAIRDPMLGPYGTVWDPYGILWDNIGAYGTILDHMGPYDSLWSIWKHMGAH